MIVKVLPFRKKNNLLDLLDFLKLLDTHAERVFAMAMVHYFVHHYDELGFYCECYSDKTGFSIRADKFAKHFSIEGHESLSGYLILFTWHLELPLDEQKSRIPDITIAIVGFNTNPPTHLGNIFVEIDGNVHQKRHLIALDKYKDQRAVISGQIPLRLYSEYVQEDPMGDSFDMLLSVICCELSKIIAVAKHHFGLFADCYGKRRD